MALFYNQATLTHGGGTTVSNTTVGELLAGVTIDKTVLSTDYTRYDSLSYLVTLTNTGAAAYNGLTLTDTLGAFIPEGSTTAVVPLTYITDSLLYYIDGVSAPLPTVTVGTELTVSGINIPAGSTATLIYEVRVNEYAPLASGSTLINRATVTGTQITEPTSDTATVPVRASTDLTIAKALCPPTVAPDGTLSYTFIVQNTGNTAQDDGTLVITDTFTPALTGLTVTLNGTPLAEGTAYTYNAASGAFSTVAGAISVPEATYVTDAATGVVNVIPGVTVLTVSGTV
jgi:uncharacterized repeat protein (TIGR01451 family)